MELDSVSKWQCVVTTVVSILAKELVWISSFKKVSNCKVKENVDYTEI